MAEQPVLIAGRVLLRPHMLADARDVQRLMGDHAIADTTLKIPHPYPDGLAEQWIGNRRAEFTLGISIQFAIVLRASQHLIGGIGMTVEREYSNAEIGYWIGKPFWGQGYCTEAAAAVLRYGFVQLGLNRIWAKHMTRNPASGRVMQKVGMKHEGTLRQHVQKWGRFEDLEVYGILRSEYHAPPS